MDSRGSKFEELLELAARSCDGNLDDAQSARLETLLRDDSEARRCYLDFLALHADLATSDQAIRDRAIDEDLFAMMPGVAKPTAEKPASQPRTRRTLWTAVAVAAAVLVMALIGPAAQSLASPKPQNVAIVQSLSHRSDTAWAGQVGSIGPGDAIGPGTIWLRKGTAELSFLSGAMVKLEAPAVFCLESDRSGSLLSGALSARVPKELSGFRVKSNRVEVLDKGTEFGMKVAPGGQTDVVVYDGIVETHAIARRPKMFWDFSDGGKEGISGEIHPMRSRPKKGLVGGGALWCEPSKETGLNIGSGAGTDPGTGRFATTTGISIEALIVSRWSGSGWSTGSRPDYDQIFRKEDGAYRMLLCFQNDDGNRAPTFPPVLRGRCLSFGLHLDVEGYSELDLPLDGLDGRPSFEEITDGEIHHVVATYDSSSGVKTLYFDGVPRISAIFPKGTSIISGGGASAWIGNNASGSELFNGVIDEFAFYDFALSPEEVAEHYRLAADKQSYLDFPSKTTNESLELTKGQRMSFDGKTGKAVQQ